MNREAKLFPRVGSALESNSLSLDRRRAASIEGNTWRRWSGSRLWRSGNRAGRWSDATTSRSGPGSWCGTGYPDNLDSPFAFLRVLTDWTKLNSPAPEVRYGWSSSLLSIASVDYVACYSCCTRCTNNSSEWSSFRVMQTRSLLVVSLADVEWDEGAFGFDLYTAPCRLFRSAERGPLERLSEFAAQSTADERVIRHTVATPLSSRLVQSPSIPRARSNFDPGA